MISLCLDIPAWTLQIQAHTIGRPVSVNDVAKALGIKVRLGRLVRERFQYRSSAIQWDPASEEWIIRINKDDCPERQRYSAAMGIARWCLFPDKARIGIVEDVRYRSAPESPAATTDTENLDTFRLANEIIMPRDRVLADNRQWPGRTRYMASLYQVPFAVMEQRLKELEGTKT